MDESKIFEAVIKPKLPIDLGWTREAPPPAVLSLGYPCAAWWHDANRLQVLSAVEVVSDPGQPSLGPEYHLSISAENVFGKKVRCSSADALWVLGQFDLTDAKEDNHVPSGIVRNFWRPVADPLSGFDCPCVDEEPSMPEDKGDFVWRGVRK